MSNKKRRRDRQTKDLERQFHADYVYTELPNISLLDLMDAAIDYYNDRNPQNQDLVDYYTDIDIIYRLCVNYARHVLLPGYDASYDRPLKHLSYDERKDIAFKAASSKIAMKWPDLAGVCEQQVRKR